MTDYRKMQEERAAGKAERQRADAEKAARLAAAAKVAEAQWERDFAAGTSTQQPKAKPAAPSGSLRGKSKADLKKSLDL